MKYIFILLLITGCYPFNDFRSVQRIGKDNYDKYQSTEIGKSLIIEDGNNWYVAIKNQNGYKIIGEKKKPEISVH